MMMRAARLNSRKRTYQKSGSGKILKKLEGVHGELSYGGAHADDSRGIEPLLREFKFTERDRNRALRLSQKKAQKAQNSGKIICSSCAFLWQELLLRQTSVDH